MNTRDAINEILLSLNELPLDASDAVDDIQIAVVVNQELEIARKKVLAQGWFFNKMTRTLYPNTLGYIIIPSTFLSVDGGDAEPDLIVRDWKLFDKGEMSYLFTEPKDCIVTEDISFDDIPFAFADYIVQIASLKAYINIIGNTEDIAVRREEVNLARIAALREDARMRDANVLEGTFVTDTLNRESI